MVVHIDGVTEIFIREHPRVDLVGWYGVEGSDLHQDVEDHTSVGWHLAIEEREQDDYLLCVDHVPEVL